MKTRKINSSYIINHIVIVLVYHIYVQNWIIPELLRLSFFSSHVFWSLFIVHTHLTKQTLLTVQPEQNSMVSLTRPFFRGRGGASETN